MTLSADIVTDKGTISVDLFPDKTPITVANFAHEMHVKAQDVLKKLIAANLLL